MRGSDNEIERRRATAAAGTTDQERWRDPANLEAAWDRRAEIAATLIPCGARVLDLGCGAMALERFLPGGCSYLPCDLVARDARTLVCDFNAGEFPQSAECDLVAALGVLEYVANVPAFLARLRELGVPAVVSYNVAGEGPPDRRALGWVNDYARSDLPGLVTGAGFARAFALELGAGQLLLRLNPHGTPRKREKTVWAVSYASSPNFGDRLGVQLLSQVLPAHAVVRHVFHAELPGAHEPPPDLLILGLGNSLYSDLLTDELVALVERSPLSLGIFGTQYRETLPAERLGRILDRLDSWHARSEEDALIYGRGRSNVRHLGDWLVEAFPMARGLRDETLEIRQSDVAGLSLDRIISGIQTYRRVTSGRLHPLLCALTSAEQVAYAEQAELPGAGESGKFRSLLLDIFGCERPQHEMWRVDRDAVVTYKQRVREAIGRLGEDLTRLLA